MLQADFPVGIRTPLLAFDTTALATAVDNAGIVGLNGDMFRLPSFGLVNIARIIMQITDAPANAKIRAAAILAQAGASAIGGTA